VRRYTTDCGVMEWWFLVSVYDVFFLSIFLCVCLKSVRYSVSVGVSKYCNIGSGFLDFTFFYKQVSLNTQQGLSENTLGHFNF